VTLKIVAIHSSRLVFSSLFAFHNFCTLRFILAKSDVWISNMTLCTTWKLL
jgi:hypothetical protein